MVINPLITINSLKYRKDFMLFLFNCFQFEAVTKSQSHSSSIGTKNINKVLQETERWLGAILLLISSFFHDNLS